MQNAGAVAVLPVRQNIEMLQIRIAFQSKVGFVQHGVGGKQNQDTAGHCLEDLRETVDEHSGIDFLADLGVIGEVSGNGNTRLLLIVEGRWCDIGKILFFCQQIQLRGVFQVIGDGQRGRGENHTFIAVKEPFLQQGHHIDGRHRETQVGAPAAAGVFNPVNIMLSLLAQEGFDKVLLFAEPALAEYQLLGQEV